MPTILRGIVLIAALMLSGGAAFATTANELIPHCRAWLENVTTGKGVMDQSICFGIVRGIAFAAPNVCRPDGVTSGQALRVVVQYIEQRPARMHEDFEKLALEALRVAWPCKQ